jgi:hypothetical protein
LQALKYAREKSIILTDEEADALETTIKSANLSETFSPHSKKIPDNIVINFFAENPIMITLNEIIVAVREKQPKNPEINFAEIFKIALAYRDRMIDTFK